MAGRSSDGNQAIVTQSLLLRAQATSPPPCAFRDPQPPSGIREPQRTHRITPQGTTPADPRLHGDAVRPSHDPDALLAGRTHQALVERDKGALLSERVSEVEVACELHGVFGTKGMSSKHTHRPVHDDRRQLHDEHRREVSVDPARARSRSASSIRPWRRRRISRADFNRGQSAGRWRVGGQEPSHAQRSRFAHVALGERAGIEVAHQNRSSRSASTAVDSRLPRPSIGRNGGSSSGAWPRPSLPARPERPSPQPRRRSDAVLPPDGLDRSRPTSAPVGPDAGRCPAGSSTPWRRRHSLACGHCDHFRRAT